VKSVWFWLLMASLIMLSACGGGSQNGSSLAGNWQFAVTAPSDKTFAGGIQSGFLLQKQNSVSGSTLYSISLPGDAIPCNSGAAIVSGSMNGQQVTLTAVAGGQTFTLNGTLSADGSTMAGTYSSSVGPQTTKADGTVVACGSAQSGLPWSARLVPTLTGEVSGNLHSQTVLQDQDFPFSGTLSQSANSGASSAMVTGTLTFMNYYPCLGTQQTVNVTGEISGDSVILQLFSGAGVQIGQIGAPVTSANPSPVTFQTLASGTEILRGSRGYSIVTKACSGEGDFGNVCMAVQAGGDNLTTACTQPILLTPSFLSFPAQTVGSNPVTQTITLTNADPAGTGNTLTGLSLELSSASYIDSSFTGISEFDQQPDFTEQDTCSNSPGSTFSLGPLQSCVISISFSPQQSCTWLPETAGGIAPALCPPFEPETISTNSYVPPTIATPPARAARLTVKSSLSVDADTSFVVPITGVGQSALVPSTPELDFGAEAVSETSLAQVLSFTNQGVQPVQILPAANSPCSSPGVSNTLLQPVQSGQVAGLQVVQGSLLGGQYAPPGSGTSFNTISYICDLDGRSKLPNFVISSDTCTGSLLAPSESCSLNIAYSPQPSSVPPTGLDDFLQLNTQKCWGSLDQPYCEIDSGRFPVELKANAPSPLRMSPGAGLDFGSWPKGQSSAPLTIILSNDRSDPNAGTVYFKGDVVKGDFTETDNCGASLAPGASCAMSIVFTPTTLTFEQGTITISYTVLPASLALGNSPTQTIYLRGSGQ